MKKAFIMDVAEGIIKEFLSVAEKYICDKVDKRVNKLTQLNNELFGQVAYLESRVATLERVIERKLEYKNIN